MTKLDEVYQNITDTVIEQLKDAKQWSKPWVTLGSDLPQNGITGRPYSGLNWLIFATAPYKSNKWLTYNQIKDLGGNVKGQKSTTIQWYGTGKSKKEKDAKGDPKRFRYAKAYHVFNIEQIEDLNMDKLKHYDVDEEVAIDDFSAVVLAESNGASIEYSGNKACFIPSVDHIKMPPANRFESTDHFEATLLHELTHWTGHSKRLNRTKGKRFGDRDYAFEELIAELGSAMAGQRLGLPYEGLQHADYIANWLGALDDDPKYIVEAAVEASKAVNYLIDGIAVEELEVA